MKLPLITKSTRPIYPRNKKCPICSAKIGEPNSFLFLNGGALKQLEKDLLGMDNDLFGFLEIHFQGAYGKGKGEHKGQHIFKQIITHSACGKFELFFCSTKCFRKFVNNIIDDIETELINNE